MIGSYTTAFRDRIALQAGVLYTGATTSATVLGLTNGGWTFDEGAEMAEIENDGLLVPMHANERITGYAPKLSGTMIATTLANLTLMMPGASSSTVSGTTTITPINAGSLYLASNYFTDVRLVVELNDAKYLAIRFPSALIKFTALKTAKNTPAEYTVEAWARAKLGDLPSAAWQAPYRIEELSNLTFPA